IQFGDDDRGRLAGLAGGFERGGQLRAAVERIGALPSLDLDEPFNDAEAFLGGEAVNGFGLGLQTQPALALPLGAYPAISDGVPHVLVFLETPQRSSACIKTCQRGTCQYCI